MSTILLASVAGAQGKNPPAQKSTPVSCNSKEVEWSEKKIISETAGSPRNCTVLPGDKRVNLKEAFELKVTQSFILGAGKADYVFGNGDGHGCTIIPKMIDSENNREFGGEKERIIHVNEIVISPEFESAETLKYDRSNARDERLKEWDKRGCKTKPFNDLYGKERYGLVKICPSGNFSIELKTPSDPTIKSIKCREISNFGNVVSLFSRGGDGGEIKGFPCYTEKKFCYKKYHPTIQAYQQNKNTTEDTNTMVNIKQKDEQVPNTLTGPDDGPDDYDQGNTPDPTGFGK